MPSSNFRTFVRAQPDSWPSSSSPRPPSLDEDIYSTDEDTDTPLLQDNPLTYFLTPATPKNEELEFDFDFDAGIEDPNHPREIVRSVSPSTLDGLKKYKPRSKHAESAILDPEDDDDEDYVRYNPTKSLPFGFEDFFDRPKRPASPSSPTTQASLSPNSFHVGSPRGRPSKRFAPPRRPFNGRSSGLTLERRHSWREPSPDVWSIEEEPEKETMSEMGLSVEDLAGGEDKSHPIDIPAARPKKRVRFVLPAKE
jgi:hypothetical protein